MQIYEGVGLHNYMVIIVIIMVGTKGASVVVRNVAKPSRQALFEHRKVYLNISHTIHVWYIYHLHLVELYIFRVNVGKSMIHGYK